MISLGIAGIPIGCKNCNTEQGIEYTAKLGLNAFELEFVHGVRLTEDKAKRIKAISQDMNIILSSHAPYYINLLSRDKNVLERSKQHIIQALRITDIAGGYVTAIHTGYLLPLLGKDENYRIVKDIYRELDEYRKNIGIRCRLGPESRGKLVGFGSMDFLIRLYQDVDVLPIFDIAHLQATREYDFRSKDEYYRFFKDVEIIDRLHIHFSEIEYNDKGEIKHLNLTTKYIPDYRIFLDVAIELGVNINVILETPDLENSAMRMREYLLK